MKKSYFLVAVVALVALMAGCKKDQELVTLGAVIESPGKSYINDSRYPCWHNGDKVYINTDAYTISAASGPSAQIVDVVSADAYRAVFPARIVTPGSDITNSTGIPVTLPSAQTYTVDDEGHQRVDAPMGAYITSGTTLGFHNLCSIVRVVVNNATGSDLSVGSIILKTNNAHLSGTGTASINGTAESSITMDANASHSVSLRIPSESPVTVATSPVSFDIVVPGFSTDNVTITLNTADGKYFELTKNNVALVHNTVTTVTLNVSSLTDIVAAELVDGETFNAAIPDNATAVLFEYNNSTVTSGTRLSTRNSPVPIYGNLDSDGTTWRVSTAARMMNANPNCYNMFSGRWHSDVQTYLPYLETIEFGDGFNTLYTECMCGMFSNCSSLVNLDVSNFNVTGVSDMGWMFNRCESLTSLDVSNFNTSNVTDMHGMFNGCINLTSLDVSNFNTSSVTDMHSMFSDCRSLTSLNLSNFNTLNVIYINHLFSGCSGLTNLDLSSFNTSGVTDMTGMFEGCSGLTSLNLSHFNTANVTDMGAMFNGCSGLTSLNISSFNTTDVGSMHVMFSDCSGLTSLEISNFNTTNVYDMIGMFSGCDHLTSLNLSNFNTSNVDNMDGLFMGCSNLTSLNLSNFDMSDVAEKSSMCYGLSTTSGRCTITCTEATQTALENGADLPTSGVEFTWVRPSSK